MRRLWEKESKSQRGVRQRQIHRERNGNRDPDEIGACALISGVGVVQGQLGDVINANEERWHCATSCPNTGKSIRMAMTPRSKEGQVHYFQTDQREQ
jgi:hypothetical protein